MMMIAGSGLWLEGFVEEEVGCGGSGDGGSVGEVTKVLSVVSYETIA